MKKRRSFWILEKLGWTLSAITAYMTAELVNQTKAGDLFPVTAYS